MSLFQSDESLAAPGQVPLAPMMDIVFLVLIFFMTLSVFYQLETELEIHVPKSEASHEEGRLPGEIIINIHADGRIVVNQQEFTLDRLKNMLASMTHLYPNQPIIIRGDQKTYHEDIVAVLDVCAQSGIWNISFATKTPEQGVRQ